MKFVRTAVPYRALVVERGDDGAPTRTISNVPLEVSDADAAKYEKLGDEVGVAVVAYDKSEDAPAELPALSGGPVAQPTPDLSEGVAVAQGAGEPVTTEQAQGAKPVTKKKAGN